MELTIREREEILQKMWEKQRLGSSSLQTLTGKKIEILYTGNANYDAGPDFKDAILKISGILLKGDIEVHLNAVGWYEHKHHLDAAYNKVILHLISENTDSAVHIEREDGVKIEQVCVPLLHSEVELWKKENRDIKTKSKEIKIVDECALSRENKNRIFYTIQTASRQRFKDKVEQIREELINDSWDQILYKKIMEALGYSKNRIPFRKLAEKLPFRILLSEMQWVPENVAKQRCAALLFGAAGLIPSLSKNDQSFEKKTISYITELNSFWPQIAPRLKKTPMQPEEWQFFRLRPQNFPTRRIAGMVEIMTRFNKTGLLDGLLNIAHANLNNTKNLISELERCFIQKASGYWESHFTFNDQDYINPKSERHLVGKERARDILLNIVFPVLYLYAEDSADGRLKNIFTELCFSFPKLAENVVTKAMKVQIYGQERVPDSTTKYAFHQQGLIQLHKLYCSSLRCNECLELSHDDL